MDPRILTLIPVLGFLCAVMDGSRAQEYTSDQLEAFFLDQARKYEFATADGGGNDGFALREQPLLKWTNPTRLQNKGSLFVWTNAGRPQILASIFSFSFSNRVRYRHEIYSLVEHPLKASLAGREVWTPDATDADWRPLPQLEAPSSNGARRLAQMRRMARRFEGEVGGKEGTSTTRLKLMPQPLFRYSSEEFGVLDGGIFGLAVATDPEVYLLIESRKANGSKGLDDAQQQGLPTWQYTIAPSTYFAVSISLGGDTVWKQERNMALQGSFEGQEPLASNPYFTFFTREPLGDPATLQELVDKATQ